MLINLFDPGIEIFKALCICAVVCKDDTVCSLVICLRNGPKPFLAGSVPDLQLDDFISNLDLLALEIYSDSCLVMPCELVV